MNFNIFKGGNKMDKYNVLMNKVNEIYNVYYVEHPIPHGMKQVCAKIVYDLDSFNPKRPEKGELFIASEYEKIGYEKFATKELYHFNDLSRGDSVFIGNRKYTVVSIDRCNKEIHIDDKVIENVIGREEASVLLASLQKKLDSMIPHPVENTKSFFKRLFR